MDEKPRSDPSLSPARQARLEREAAALRENLRKRKEQARARQEGDPTEPGPTEPGQTEPER